MPVASCPPTPDPNQDLADGWKEAEGQFLIKGSPDTIFRLGIRVTSYLFAANLKADSGHGTDCTVTLCLPLTLAVQAPPPPLTGTTTVNHVTSSPGGLSTTALEQKRLECFAVERRAEKAVCKL